MNLISLKKQKTAAKKTVNFFREKALKMFFGGQKSTTVFYYLFLNLFYSDIEMVIKITIIVAEVVVKIFVGG